MPMSQSLSCSAPKRTMALHDWTLNGDGACLMAWLTHMTMRSSEMGDSLARERMERRTLMADRNGVWYAILLICIYDGLKVW